MKLKKMLAPLAVLAFAAAVFVAPAAAQAQVHFFNDEEPIELGVGGAGPTLHYTGEARFENAAGGIACEEVTAIVEFTTLDAHVTVFNPVTNCATTGALPLLGCELESPTAPEATNLPWTIDPLTIGEGTVTENGTGGPLEIDNPLAPGCAIGLENIHAFATAEHMPNIVAVEPGNFDTVELTGELETDLGPVNVEGHLTVTPGERGTITAKE